MASPEVIEQFYGVYLLYCKNPQFLGRTYIGYTVNPDRRIKQHNLGQVAGGAKKTSTKGPWVMVMIIHGFPNNISALQFEWAWQTPLRSRRLCHLKNIKKMRKENTFQYNTRILSEMLRVGPWSRLPLSVRWLADEFVTEFAVDKSPPLHMPICYGPVEVVSKRIPNTQAQTQSSTNVEQTDTYTGFSECNLCNEIIDKDISKITCLTPKCSITCHIICLAQRFFTTGEYIPIQGICPKCGMLYLWGDLIRKARGCYGNLRDTETQDDSFSSDSEVDE